jgi:hypothetical protein
MSELSRVMVKEAQGSRKPVFARPAICDPKVKPHVTRAMTLGRAGVSFEELDRFP